MTENQLLVLPDETRAEEASSDHVRFPRGMLSDFIGLLAYTGMRPFEAMKLQWHDIETFKMDGGKSATKLFVSGKNKERSLVARDRDDRA